MGDEILLERILNGEEEPKDLPLALLQRITNDFSEDRKIGQGGFGAVYKGVLRSGIIVAVKRIYINLHRIDVDDKLFRREFNSMWRTNHQNVVRCLGFCSNTSMKPIEKDGSKEIALANVRERLFCLEYIGNGSLDKHITDELRGLGWKTRYEIITGICEGLCYLHEEKKIVHMDLKPANVLLHGKYMVPKITDFGLSRSDENSHTMAQPIGTVGYIAPEYVKDGKTSHKSDIYSLGAIIFELVTGCMSAPDKNSVLRRWRHRWNKPPTPLQYQQVTRCFEIAVRCRQKEPKDRPSIGDIISFLRKSESTDGDGHTGQGSTYLDDDMLRIEPLELIFDEEMSWSVKLTNKTKACFAFSIERPSKHYTIQPDKGIVTPGFKEYLVQIAMKAPQVTQNADKLIVRSTKVNEGLRVEDFPKDIFYEVAGKVVDEVDLMVLYEPGSLKSGQDPNVPVEAVSPEAINSNSYKDSAQGQCTKQLDRRNYHPPENFSRSQPTNMTYLLKVSDRAVDVTRGTMGSLLHKLGEVIKEFNLETSIKEDIESLSEELMKMQPVLRKVSEVKQDNLDDLVKRWAINVREMSYDLEDFVDSFLVHSEPDSNTSSFKELTHELCFLLEEGKSNHTIGHLIKDKTKQVQHEARRRKEYNVDDVVALAAATITDTIDPCMLVVFQRPKELVGIEEPRDNLIKRLSQVSEQQLRIFSIYGAGGSGKTTLAKAVYDKLEGQFHLMAFVSVGRNPDKKQVLRDIIDELPNDSNIATMDEKQLIKELHKLLKNNRYFIVIDDIWDSSAWSIIECAFPENNRGSRVVTTTRIHSVAVACCDDSRKYVCEMETLNDRDSRILFVSRIFGMEDAFPNVPEDILTGILKKCGGLPLAIISIASLVAKKDPRRRSTWDYVSKSLIAMFEGDNPTLTDMEQILNLSYMHLPNHLKTCLLSVGKYREDQEIEKDELLRQWIAEGFVVSTSHGLDAEDVAEDYFSELINMSMIQSVKIDYNNEVLSCRVHDIMLDLIRSKAAEENFIHVVHGLKDVSGAHGEIRRVSVHYYDSTILETIKESLSHVRSVKLDLIRSKAAEENLDDFFNGSDGLKEVTDAQGSFFPVSVIDNNTILETMSHVRSVLSERAALLSSRSRVLCFSQYKYLRVLHIEHLFHSLDLTGISRLFLLRYLKVGWSSNYYCELKLPSEIGELHQLETIDLDGASRLKRYPSNIVSLPRLSLLRFGGAGIPLPDGIGRLKSLRTLGGVALYESSVENIKGISQLTNLRKLEIRRNDHKRLPKGVAIMRMDALHSSICMLSASLRNLTFEGGWDRPVDVPACWSGTLFPGCCNIGELNLGCCRFERCPRWISQLHNLYKFTIMVWEVADGISIAAGLASLAYFRLVIFDCSKRERLVIFNYHYEEKEERVVIPGTGFQARKHLIFHCPNASLTFETGAMPKLEKLDIKFHYDMTRRFLPVGIQHLPAPTLAKIWLSVAKIWKGLVFGSKDCEEQLRDVSRKAKMSMTMLKSAFKQHHPVADIYAEEENDISNCIMTNKKILRAPLGPSS